MESLLTFLSKHANTFDSSIHNYIVPALNVETSDNLTKNESLIKKESVLDVLNSDAIDLLPGSVVTNNFIQFQEREIHQQRFGFLSYMDPQEINCYMSLTKKRDMKNMLNKKIGPTPKGFGRCILTEFMLGVTLFCKNKKFDHQKCSIILTVFYLTHKYFTDFLHTSPECVYNYFKECLFMHSIDYPPTHKKTFTMEESKTILLFFSTFYLRHLPLIRTLTLPNFGLKLNFQLPIKKKTGKEKGNKKDKKPSKKK